MAGVDFKVYIPVDFICTDEEETNYMYVVKVIVYFFMDFKLVNYFKTFWFNNVSSDLHFDCDEAQINV